MAGKESVTKLANNEEKKKALDAAIAKLEKDFCLLYTSDAADEEDSVDLGGPRII